MKKNVLIVISGMSPTIITETVWALARQTPPVVPDKIIVLTTRTGKQRLLEMLQFDRDSPSDTGPWGALRKALAKEGVRTAGRLILTESTIRVFTGRDEKPLDDLVTRDENLRAANLMMRVIRDYAEDGDWTIHAQLAGGRKTMSALFFSCMCLLGRPGDHIYHVLVSEGYDNPQLVPPFFFPQRGIFHTCERADGTRVRIPSSKARVNLFDVPFVPMGEWAEQKCRGRSKGLSYENVIHAVNAGLDGDVFPKFEIDLSERGDVSVDGRPVRMPHFEFVLLTYVLQGVCAGNCLARMRDLKDFLCTGDGVDTFLFDKGNFRWLERFMGDESKQTGHGKFAWYDERDIRQRDSKVAMDFNRTLFQVRKLLANAQDDASWVDRLLNRDGFPRDFDCSLVSWHGYEKLPKDVQIRLFLPETRKRLGIEGA